MTVSAVVRANRKKRRIATEGKGVIASGKLGDPILSSDPNSSSSYSESCDADIHANPDVTAVQSG